MIPRDLWLWGWACKGAVSEIKTGVNWWKNEWIWCALSVATNAKVMKSMCFSPSIIYTIIAAVLAESTKTSHSELWEKVVCPVLPETTVTSVPLSEFPRSKTWTALSIEYWLYQYVPCLAFGISEPFSLPWPALLPWFLSKWDVFEKKWKILKINKVFWYWARAMRMNKVTHVQYSDT